MLTVLPSGEVEFEIVLPDARCVEVLGDFTQWEGGPVSMSSGATGKWSVRLQIDPGEHLFKYRIDGWRWLTDFAAHGVEMNEFGSWNSQLCIPRRMAPALCRIGCARAA